VVIDGKWLKSLAAVFAFGRQEQGQRENRMTWKQVRLGAAPRFNCTVGYTASSEPPRPKFVFTLLVNNKPTQTMNIVPAAGQAPAWEPWEVDLGPYAGRCVSLELKAVQQGGKAPGRAFFGDPTLTWKNDTLYSFFVAGHVYGHPETEDNDLHPPFRSKRRFIEREPDLQFGIFTGDIVRKSSPEAWDAVDRFVGSLPVPVFFAPGNHDMVDRGLYESRYGQTYYSFMHQGDLFIVLDPNLDQWNISGAQLDFLKTVLEQHRQAEHLFVFMHQILWVKREPYFKRFIPNSIMGRAKTINYWDEVESLFRLTEKPVYLFAGDTGAFPLGREILYHAYDNIHLIASGMGGGERDNYVLVKVSEDRSVTLQVIALNGDDPYFLGCAKDHQVEP